MSLCKSAGQAPHTDNTLLISSQLLLIYNVGLTLSYLAPLPLTLEHIVLIPLIGPLAPNGPTQPGPHGFYLILCR